MKLLLSDTFYEALLTLPKSIQKKVIAFQKKFMTNTTSNGIHLEPISQFKDTAMRTARVDDNYRVIVGILEDSYYLLYVGTHNNAYNWGIKKKFVWNDHTQMAQFVTIKESEEIRSPEVMDATKNSVLFENIPAEKILKLGVPDNMLQTVMQIQSIDDLDSLEEDLPTDVYENIFNLIDGENIDDLISDIEEGKVLSDEEKYLSNNNKRHFVELTDDNDLQYIIEQDMDKWQLFLHPSQRKLVEADYKGTIKVSGGAGTGKTVAALHRLKKLCTIPNSKVLFTTYTKTLRENLEELIKKMDIDSSRYTLNNIDKILYDCARQYHIKDGYKILDYSNEKESLKLWHEILENEKEVTEFNEQFLYDEYIDVVIYYGNSDVKQYMMQQRIGRTKAISRKQRIKIWHLIEKYVELKQSRKVVDRLELFNEMTKYFNENNIHPYTNIIADEFQDFSNPELKFLRSLVAEGKNDLFLTGDPMQRIYNGRKINFTSAGINVKGVRSVRLKINYRTTEPIKRIAVNVVKGQSYNDMDGGTESLKGYVSLIHGGEKPVYEIVNNDEEEVNKVVKWLDTCVGDGIKLKDICVAAPSKRELKKLETRLHNNGTEYKLLKGTNKLGSSNGLSLCTFHSLKGLEFKVIILIGVNEKNLPSKAIGTYFTEMDAQEKKEHLSTIRSLLYVAITRARQLVFMVGSGERTGLLELNK